MAIEYIKGKGFYGTITKQMYESELEARFRETRAASALRRAKEMAGQSSFQEMAEEFVSSEPNYVGCKENWDAMRTWCMERRIDPPTLDNLRQAFDSLSAQGLLVLREPLNQLTEEQLSKMTLEQLREGTHELYVRQELRKGD